MNLELFLSGLNIAAKAIIALAVFVVCAFAAMLFFGYQAVTSFITFLAETWIIQTLFAAWAAFQWQERSAVNSRKRERLQSAYDRKVEAAKALYGLIGRRLYASRRYLDVIESEPAKLSAEREHYRAAVKEWNEQAQVHQVTILLEFDSYFGLLIDRTYNPSFINIDSWLRRQRQAIESGDAHDVTVSRQIRSELHELNRISLDVSREMLKEARKDRNIMDEKVAITEENIDHISYTRLLKALVQPGA